MRKFIWLILGLSVAILGLFQPVFAEELADRIGILNHGKIVAEGSVLVQGTPENGLVMTEFTRGRPRSES